MDALKTAIQHFGSATALAAAIKVKPATVSQWASALRPIPVERCLEIERASLGAVTCEQLRPDVDWRRHLEPQKEAA